jgi:beta-lactamase class A
MLLIACNDVPDEPPVAGATSSPAPTATRRPRATATPRAGPTTPPLPVSTPEGTTGILDVPSGDVRLDDACLDEAAGRSDPPADPRFKPTDQPIAPPDPYAPIPFVQDRDLQDAMMAALGDEADDYAFVVKDLATGKGAAHNADRVFNAASMFKLFVMYEVFHQQSLGLIDWDTELVVSPYYDAFALSPRSTELCEVISIAGAMEAMLSVSDNAAAVMLQDVAGAGNINNAIGALGVLNSGLYTEGLPLTAADVALLLEAIGRGEAVSPQASADMLQLMSHESIDNGLVSGLPEGVTVAHKTGNWSDATHDGGIVFAETGPYVFVALSQTDHETSVIRALSHAAYEYFAGR